MNKYKIRYYVDAKVCESEVSAKQFVVQNGRYGDMSIVFYDNLDSPATFAFSNVIAVEKIEEGD
ncbi:MAG: hypothetical protein ACTSVB_00780 [Candidatus Heimdallarchaeaceae archaeon]